MSIQMTELFRIHGTPELPVRPKNERKKEIVTFNSIGITAVSTLKERLYELVVLEISYSAWKWSSLLFLFFFSFHPTPRIFHYRIQWHPLLHCSRWSCLMSWIKTERDPTITEKSKTKALLLSLIKIEKDYVLGRARFLISIHSLEWFFLVLIPVSKLFSEIFPLSATGYISLSLSLLYRRF